MTETPKDDLEITSRKNPPQNFRKGALVRVNRSKYSTSLESKASDPTPPRYIFEGPGEVLTVKGEYAQMRWRLPVPDTWLRVDQLEEWSDK
ncbi:NAD(P)H-quinone oxidoreductase subunit O [Prochlorococcus sp. MIT 1341]|uniref:NAD(P)H-quinone oxidoreductase subunit O n=1 Tax=Prochlorococcus sp. MIT 1341 TaxID=3096221 RepID=UPI002A757E8F|nr:NAD(P)H-quinone oxidoreductase subunit O [Prochlorococcus sp. MIT 1341]